MIVNDELEGSGRGLRLWGGGGGGGGGVPSNRYSKPGLLENEARGLNTEPRHFLLLADIPSTRHHLCVRDLFLQNKL
jgi:hypothetical protein